MEHRGTRKETARWRRPRSTAAVFVAIGVGSGAVIALGAWSFGRAPEVVQPLAFSHKRHVEAKMDCLACHEQAGDRPEATLPLLAKCMECHEEAKGKSLDEPRIREHVRRHEEIPWVGVNRYDGHVYFSHRAHVGQAEMDCAECHAGMKDRDTPLVRPDATIRMSACMECHEKRGASNDCLACHK